MTILNDEQRAAVLYTDGPLMVIAGPGTGKTKTVVSKISYLLEQGVDPAKICALTFTQKAAGEMRERLGKILPQTPSFIKEGVFLGTFHSLAHALLQENGQAPKISTDEQQKKIIKTIAKKHGLKPREAALRITQHKSRVNAPADPLITQYNDLLQASDFLDYDDLLLQALQLVREGSDMPRFDYLLIDEFQDTNAVQYALMQRLCLKNITIIGDPLQSIYAFRGASPESFEQFKQDFPNTREITLRKNYRSGATIITSSQALFPESASLEAVPEEVGAVTLVRTPNEYSEARWIAAEISRLMGGMDLNEAGELPTTGHQHQRFSDFAVIYRTHQVGRVLEQTFQESGIPYQLIGKNRAAYEHEEFPIAADKVVFLTMHAAKGLEFAYVFVAGFEEGLIPFTKRVKTDDELAEEKRLLYVAMTRAKHGLYLLEAKWRQKHLTQPSRFRSLCLIDEVADKALERFAKKQANLREQRRQLRLV